MIVPWGGLCPAAAAVRRVLAPPLTAAAAPPRRRVRTRRYRGAPPSKWRCAHNPRRRFADSRPPNRAAASRNTLAEKKTIFFPARGT